MPKQTFKLSANDDREICLEWRGIWKNMTVSFDGQALGTVPDSKALKQGQSFELPIGGTVEVRLKTGLQAELQVTRNGNPLPGSNSDPAVRLKIAAGITYFIAALTFGLSLAAELGEVTLLKQMGMGWLTAGVGAVFGVLGYLTSKRFAIALGIAVTLLIIDIVLTVVMTAGSGRIPTTAIVVRVLFLMPMFKGFGAIKALKGQDALAQSANRF